MKPHISNAAGQRLGLVLALACLALPACSLLFAPGDANDSPDAASCAREDCDTTTLALYHFDDLATLKSSACGSSDLIGNISRSTQGPPNLGTALKFDSPSIAGTSFVRPTGNASWTIDFWLFPNDSPGTILAAFREDEVGPCGLQIERSDAGLHVTWTSGTGEVALIADVPVQTDLWLPMAVVYVSAPATGEVRLFVDGQETTTLSVGSCELSALSLRVGAYDTGDSFTGAMDELRVRNIVATPDDQCVSADTPEHRAR